jgi:rRNA-processing protein FCF1
VQIDLIQGMVDCLYAECKPCITECVMAELEKLGAKYRVALKIAKVCSQSHPALLPSTYIQAVVQMAAVYASRCIQPGL